MALKAKALKVKGLFTEWIAPEMKDIYSESAEYRDWYEKSGMIAKLPAALVPFGECEDEYITTDVDCLADRLAMSNEPAIWADEHELIRKALWTALNEGKRIEVMGLVIEPYTAEELPVTPLERFADYGPWADKLRAAVDELRGETPKAQRSFGSAWTLCYDLHSAIEELGDFSEVEVKDGKVFVVAESGERKQVFPWVDED